MPRETIERFTNFIATFELRAEVVIIIIITIIISNRAGTTAS